jgi:hypothetical protein
MTSIGPLRHCGGAALFGDLTCEPPCLRSSPTLGFHASDEAPGLSRRRCNRGLAGRRLTSRLLCAGSPIADQILFRGSVAAPLSMGRLANVDNGAAGQKQHQG